MLIGPTSVLCDQSGILVASSSDVNPVNKFVDLYMADQLPAPMNEGTIDPKILKLYVMLHDNQEGPVDRYSSCTTFILLPFIVISRLEVFASEVLLLLDQYSSN